MNETYTTNYKLWKKILSVFLSLIIAFGTFVSMTFGNLFLSDYINLKNLIIAQASTTVPQYYRYNELIGLYKNDYQNNEIIQYKIGEDGEWQNYNVPFAIPAFQTTRVYSRIGENGDITYKDYSTTNKALGVYEESNTDFDFSYNNVSFEYTRSYNSADKKWFDSIDSFVSVSGNLAIVTLPDGSKYNLIKTDTNKYVDELYGYILESQSNEYIFHFENYDYCFSLDSGCYYLSQIKDNFSNTLTLNRNVTLVDFTISDETGRSFSIEETYSLWEPFGFLRDITDPNGNEINYMMDFNSKDYITVTDQAGVCLGNYEYTNERLSKSNGNTIEYYDNGRLKKITYQNGYWIQYTYNDESMNYTTLTSSGETTKTVYNDAFYPTAYTDKYGLTTAYTYDDHYRILSQICDTKATTYTYDENGYLTSYIISDTNKNTYYTYDSNKRIIREQVGNDYKYFAYDIFGNNIVCATLKADYTGEAPALYDSTLDCFDTTTYTYDDKGRVTSEIYSTGGSVAYEYDNRGNVTKETTVTVKEGENETKVVTYTYDAFGNLLTSSTGNDTSSYIYDAAGRTLLANENGEYTRTIYDNLGRVVQEIGPDDYDSTKDSLPTANTYSDANVGYRYFYNEGTGNLDREINRLGIETTYSYYSTGEKEKECFDIYEFDYNIKGNLTKVYVDGVNTLTYNYDEDYNLTSEVYANGQSIRYEYNDNGNLVRQYHNNDTSPYLTYSYNEDNEPTQKINTDTGLKYVYGENDQVSVYRTSDNTLIQSYTEVKTEENTETNTPEYTTVTENHFGNTYTSVIRDKSISYTSGENTAQYSYVTSLIGDDEKISSDSIQYAGNTVVPSTYTYDDDGNIVKKTTAYTADGASYTVDFLNEYDSKGRITANGFDDISQYYSYDSYSQLTRVDSQLNNPYTATYTYDIRGNLTSKNVYDYTRESLDGLTPTSTTTFTYANTGWKDQLVAVNGTELTYDANGNVLTYGSKEYSWTNGRDLAQITDGDNTYSYTYDENGIRTSKTVNGATTYYNTKDGVILSQTDSTDTWYFQYDSNGAPMGFIRNGVQYFYMTNQMGDVIGINDCTGDSLVIYLYDEWGKVTEICPTLSGTQAEFQYALGEANPLRYRGYYYDNETGYYYLQSRYYDATICRFINADKFDYTDKDLYCGNNIYSYCANNPIIHKDPSGHFLLIILIILAISKSMISNTLSPYLSKIVSASTRDKFGTSNKGKIKVELDYSSSFISDLHSAYKSNPSGTAGVIAEYAERKFNNVMKRDIVFDRDCLEFEISVHIAAFLIAKKFRDISRPDGISESAFNKIVKHATPIDILEADVYDGTQSILFSYFYGIRSKYYKTKKDPYYYYTGLIKNRSTPANPSWKSIKL